MCPSKQPSGSESPLENNSKHSQVDMLSTVDTSGSTGVGFSSDSAQARNTKQLRETAAQAIRIDLKVHMHLANDREKVGI